MTLVLFLAQDREDKKEVVVKVLAFILQNFDCNLYLKGAVGEWCGPMPIRERLHSLGNL
jgi:hypothetical protein